MKYLGLSFLRAIRDVVYPPVISCEFIFNRNPKKLIVVESTKPNVEESALQLAKYLKDDCSIAILNMKRRYFYHQARLQETEADIANMIKFTDEIYVSSPNSIFTKYCNINIHEIKKITFYQHGILNDGFLNGVRLLKSEHDNVFLGVWDDEVIKADICFGTPKRYQNRNFDAVNLETAKKIFRNINKKIVLASNAHSPEVDKILAFKLAIHLIVNHKSMLVFCPHPDERWYNSLSFLMAKLLRCDISSIDLEQGGILVSLPSTVLFDTFSQKYVKKICII